ncbi:MAG: hypothetical protein ACJ8AD_20140 [Gemmatimonadaceae bacterium]
MRRPSPLLPRLRGVLVLLALLSQVGFGNAQSLQCGMHGLGALRSELATTDASAASGHAAAHHGDSDTGDQGCHCTCTGDCSAAVSVPAAPMVSTLRVAIVVARPEGAFDVAPTLPERLEPERLLPFANGPPATALL